MGREIITQDGGNEIRYRKKKKAGKHLYLPVILLLVICALIIFRTAFPLAIEEKPAWVTPLETIRKWFIEDPSSYEKTLAGPFQFVRAKDGDTIVLLDEKNEEFTVRLIGIDTPESVHVDESKNTEEGKIASDWLKSQFESELPHELYLEYDVVPEDEYGRTLAYVFFDKEGTRMLNQFILENGYATTLTIPPNTKYANQFYLTYLEARQAKKGLWQE